MKNINNIREKNIQKISTAKIYKVMGCKFNLKNLDYVFFIGVIHYIIELVPTLKNKHKCLKKDGNFIMWVYRYDVNEYYYFMYRLLSFFTKKMNVKFLEIIKNTLNILLILYIYVSRINQYLLTHSYLENMFSKFTFERRKFIIFDQLNPYYSKYYKKNEYLKLLKNVGFKIQRYNNYCWILKGSK